MGNRHDQARVEDGQHQPPKFPRGVSCSSASARIAVGYYYPTTTPIPKLLAERWNGTSWAIQIIPTPAGTTESDLESVSCTSASACTAIGTYLASLPVKVLAERWNGTSWAIQTTPNPSTIGANSLFGVSCRSARSCTAVGSDGTALLSVPLAEHWNGKAWAIQASPNPGRRLAEVARLRVPRRGWARRA